MTGRQRQLVQATFQRIKPIQDLTASLFYARLLELDPSLKWLFKVDLKQQGRRLMLMINLAVKRLERLDDLPLEPQKTGFCPPACGFEQHRCQHVRPALLWTLEYGLGTAFTPEVKEAWSTFYGLLAEPLEDVAMAI